MLDHGVLNRSWTEWHHLVLICVEVVWLGYVLPLLGMGKLQIKYWKDDLNKILVSHINILIHLQ